jgi:hypothetical protein
MLEEGHRMGFPLEPPKEINPADVFISDFWPTGL